MSRRDRTREVVLALLSDVDEQGAYANLALPPLLQKAHLDARDAALATELSYGTVRCAGTLDEIASACSTRPLAEIEASVLRLIRLGAYQLLRTRIPAHAALASTVELAKRTGNARASGFINAVLRKISSKTWDEWIIALSTGDPLADMARRYAHPRWIARAFADALVDETELDVALAADDQRPQTHLVAWPGRIDRETLCAQSQGEPGPYAPTAVRLPGGDPADVPALTQHLAGVQDEGSQLCALALTQAQIEGRDQHWLDLCAGPGGKTALLAAVAAQRGAHVTANELHPHRARLIRKLTTGMDVTVVTGDARQLRPADHGAPADGFDRVLLDAPCSGLGALRRRPESRWRRNEADLAELTQLQQELLASAVQLIRPGGVIGYVTCSPHRAETLDVVGKLLDSHPELVRPIAEIPGFPDDSSIGEGMAQLWPHRHSTDAMFCALLRRTDG